MSRVATGTVDWRGTPPRWVGQFTVHDADGVAHRVRKDLERPDLGREDKEAARRAARQLAATLREQEARRDEEVHERTLERHEAVEGSLTRALDAAVAAGRWETVTEIARAITAARAGRSLRKR